jgi:subtilisin family serine protease
MKTIHLFSATLAIILFSVVNPLSAEISQKSDTLKYRILLSDKSATTFSLQHPEAFLSAKAIARRTRQHLSIDSTDIPVCDKYIEEIRKQGVKIVAKGKWNNFVTVSCNNPQKIEKIKKLNFVRSIELVWRRPAKYSPSTDKRDSLINVMAKSDSIYGASLKQIKLCNGIKLHDSGYRGKGMVIAIIDAGYHNADAITGLKNTHILGTHDFVDSHSDIFAKSHHGLAVLSIMGMNMPHYMIGSAPEASYWLLRSEDEESENIVEHDYWSEAIEFADSVGVDVVNSSLGYYVYDDTTKNMRFCDLDGKSCLISKEASMAASKGIVLVNSAGNTGNGPWKKISVPADAKDILTVGATHDTGILASFSSIGNSADGRIKPDISAMGFYDAVMGTDGTITHGNGTSFASPLMCGLVACLWQAYPKLTAKQLMEIIRLSGDRAECPDNIYGYGIPDMWKAYQLAKNYKSM